MHIRVRTLGKPDSIVVVESKLTKIEQFRRIVKDKFDVDPKLQRLFYGGKLLEDGYTFHDYNIKLNDVIQLMVKLQALEDTEIKSENKDDTTKEADPSNNRKIKYKDAVSDLYSIGDLVDMRDREQGAWFEGKIVRIVFDPKKPETAQTPDTDYETKDSPNKDSDSENNPPSSISSEEDTIKSKQKSIAEYFSKSVKKKAASKTKKPFAQNNDENLLFEVQLDADEQDSGPFCQIKEIRPRARNVIEVSDIKIGQKVMINYNTEEPSEKGYWYDFKVDEVKKTRTTHELIGTLYLGPDAVPQNDTRVKVHDKIFAIEVVVPVSQRTDEYIKLMAEQPEKRSMPLNCLTCRDDEEALCKDCGCYLCSRKELPEKIVLCDECNKGYHMDCLTPPLTELPEEDWYCPSCKRDPNDVVAPGAAKQTKKTSVSKSNKDWGRGMACVGKTKTCSMPTNHFGPIPGIEVGMCWRFRIQLSESGVHRPPVSGIHGRDVEGAYSIVLSGGYEDDVDNGIEFTYTGSGGRDLSGNKRTAEQSCDQTLTRENKALARNCAVKKISEEGGDAGEEWRNGKPVRVVRSYKMMKHFPKYAPKEGIRYDGIYKVVKYYPEKGLSGYRVWKYLLRRDDPSPAPWEPGAKHFLLVYPDGYLEAEAEKRALKEKNNKDGKINTGKRKALRESNHSSESEGSTPPAKKVKTKAKPNEADKQTKKRGRPSKNKSVAESPKKPVKIPDIFNLKSPKTKKPSEQVLSDKEREAVVEDTLNNKLWDECLAVSKNKGKKEFIEHVTQVFLCIICQEVVANPVTTPCLHNFCMGCIKLAFKSNESQSCPYCRQSLAKYEPQHNEHLKAALRVLMPGYDAGKK